MATRRTTAAKKTKAKTKASKKSKPRAKAKAPKKSARAKAPAKAKVKAKAKAKARAPKARSKTSKGKRGALARVAQAAKKVVKKVAAKAKKVAANGKAAKSKSAATYLGRAASMNASISLLVVDGAAAADAWKGVDPDDLDSIEAATTKIAHLGSELDDGKPRAFKLGTATGVGFELCVGKGMAHVFRVKDRLVMAEAFIDDLERADFLAYVASPTAHGAVDGGTIDADSGVLALMVPGGAYEDLPRRLSSATDESNGARIGSEMPGLLVKVPARKYRLLVEPETSGPFGEAARAVLEPV